MCEKNSGVGVPSAIREDVLLRLGVDDALVDVHGAAGLLGMRLGHERGVHLVAQRGFARGALEEEGLVGEVERIAVQQVDLHLRGAVLVDQRVDLDVLVLAELVHVVEQRIELVDRRDAVALAARLGAARTAHRRLERIVGVDVGLDQVELELRRHHRLPAAVRVHLQDVRAARRAAPCRRAGRRRR